MKSPSEGDDTDNSDEKGSKKEREKVPTEEDLQRNIQIIEMTRNRIEVFSREAESIGSSIRDHLRAKETLDAMKAMEKATEMLIPVGAGVFVHAKPTTTKKVVYNLGVEIGAELSIEDASDRLDLRMKSLEDKERQVVGELQKLEISAEALTRETQAMYERYQESMKMKGSK